MHILIGVLEQVQQGYLENLRTTRHIRDEFKHMADSKEKTKHRDVHPTETRKGEQQVMITKDAIQSFLNPLAVDTKDQLVNISSGSAAPDDVTQNVLRVEAVGEKTCDEFIEKRLKTGKDFFEPVKQMKLRTRMT